MVTWGFRFSGLGFGFPKFGVPSLQVLKSLKRVIKGVSYIGLGSKLLEGSYIADYIGDYYGGLLRGVVGI